MKADILLKDNHEKKDKTGKDILLKLKRLKKMEEVQVLIDKLDFDNSFFTEEFVKYDKSEIIDKIISDEEILKAVLPNQNNKIEKNSLLPIQSGIFSYIIFLNMKMIYILEI